MTASEKFTAIQTIMDTQKAIESAEDDFIKAHASGDIEKETNFGNMFDQLMAKRNGMIELIRSFGEKIERHDYIMVELNGDRKQKTSWYFA